MLRDVWVLSIQIVWMGSLFWDVARCKQRASLILLHDD